MTQNDAKTNKSWSSGMQSASRSSCSLCVGKRFPSFVSSTDFPWRSVPGGAQTRHSCDDMQRHSTSMKATLMNRWIEMELQIYHENLWDSVLDIRSTKAHQSTAPWFSLDAEIPVCEALEAVDWYFVSRQDVLGARYWTAYGCVRLYSTENIHHTSRYIRLLRYCHMELRELLVGIGVRWSGVRTPCFLRCCHRTPIALLPHFLEISSIQSGKNCNCYQTVSCSQTSCWVLNRSSTTYVIGIRWSLLDNYESLAANLRNAQHFWAQVFQAICLLCDNIEEDKTQNFLGVQLSEAKTP